MTTSAPAAEEVSKIKIKNKKIDGAVALKCGGPLNISGFFLSCYSQNETGSPEGLPSVV